MNINDAFASYLKSADLMGKPIRVTISSFIMEDVGTEQKPERKPVIYFQGRAKGMVLNKTNSNMIAELFGPETDDWTGQIIELYVARVDFGGKLVDAIRVRAPSVGAAAQPAAQPATKSQAEMDDDIPF